MQNTEDSHDSDSIVFAIAFAIACDFSATALGEDWKKLQIMIMEQTFKLIECLSPEELLHWMEKKLPPPAEQPTDAQNTQVRSYS
ncbi:MAG: hypothetical protein HEQ19_13930 [Gloeotrichia echinulata CP02]|jgi:hypothetical protein|nr:hypothetical protein [Gloeotrichia echinulata DEX184]